MRSLSIIIPAYNEEKRISKTLDKVINFLSHQAYKSEVIIVDDASFDDTYQIAKKISSPSNKIAIRVLQHATNKGKGAAVKKGVMNATSDYILFMDADDSTDIKEIKKLLPYIKSSQIVIGSRYLDKNSIKIKQPFMRRILSRAGNYLIKLILRLDFADTQCGFKLLEAHIAKDIFSRSEINRWGFDIEILVIAKNLGYQTKEVAVDWLDSPGTQLRAGKAAYHTFFELLKIKRNLKQGKYN